MKFVGMLALYVVVALFVALVDQWIFNGLVAGYAGLPPISYAQMFGLTCIFRAGAAKVTQ